ASAFVCFMPALSSTIARCTAFTTTFVFLCRSISHRSAVRSHAQNHSKISFGRSHRAIELNTAYQRLTSSLLRTGGEDSSARISGGMTQAGFGSRLRMVETPLLAPPSCSTHRDQHNASKLRWKAERASRGVNGSCSLGITNRKTRSFQI